MGRAEQLFEQIRRGQTAEIEAMIKAPIVEELFLDYKRAASTLPATKLHADDRKNLAKAMSGFGNSEGGLIVWGVDCNPGQDGDVPIWPPPKISQPLMFKTLLDSAIGGLTLPSHSGVENLEVRYPSEADGFVVTHVPIGLNVPLQTLYPKQEFYIRAGSNFLPTPRAVLAGLFGRSPQPELRIQVERSTFEKWRDKTSVKFGFQVKCSNVGRGIAEEIFFSIDAKFGRNAEIVLATLDSIGDVWPNPSVGAYRATLLTKPFRFPPLAAKIFFEFGLVLHDEPVEDVVITISCGSANSPGSARELRLPREKLHDAYWHYRADYADRPSKVAGDRLYEAWISQLLA